ATTVNGRPCRRTEWTIADVRRHDGVVVGGGNGGVSLAARLLRDGFSDVAVVSDQPVHVYRPLLNYVGGGQARMSDLERSMRHLRRGVVVFSVPPEPAPCAPTALKPLFLACDHWKRAGVLDDLDVRLVLASEGSVRVRRADAVVDRYLDLYGVRGEREAVVRA